MTFYETVTAAVADILEHGFDTQERIDGWIRRIRDSARASMVPERTLERTLRATLGGLYAKLIDKGGILRLNPGVPRYTLAQVRPQLRAELDRRLAASRNLIVLNRETMMDKTEQRFSGWATSVPAGGTDAQSRSEAKPPILKALKSLPFEERRVLIDQGHKLTSAVNAVVAEGGGAIAARWRSHWREQNYDYREDHKDRDQVIYLIRGSWADQKGYVRTDRKDGWTDDITKPAEEPFCRCYYVYLYHLRQLPPDMLTEKGRAALAASQRKVA